MQWSARVIHRTLPKKVLFSLWIMHFPLVLFFWTTCPKTTLAGGAPVFDAVNWVENASIAKKTAESLLKQAQQIKNQWQMIQNQKAELKALAHYRWRDASSLLKQLDDVERKNKALFNDIESWQKQFQDLYGDFDNNNQQLMNRYNLVQKQQQKTLASIENALGVTYIARQNTQDEEKLLHDINTQVKGATNTFQVTQAQTALQTENVQQLLTLKRLLLAKMEADEALKANQLSEAAYQDKHLQTMIKTLPTAFPTYQNNPAFGKIVME